MGSSDEEIASIIKSHWEEREDRYSEIRSEDDRIIGKNRDVIHRWLKQLHPKGHQS